MYHTTHNHTAAEIDLLFKKKAKAMALATQRGRGNYRRGFDKMHPATRIKKDARS